MSSIQFCDLQAQYRRIQTAVDARIQKVLTHGQYIMGPEIAELERDLARFAGAQHAVSVSSGTDALLIALMAKGIGNGDAVFVPAFTFTATAEVVLMAGAVPVFVDVQEGTFNIDPHDLLEKIRQVKSAGRLLPKAVIAVDLFGLPADYSRLSGIAAGHELLLLADAAQSFGATLGDRRVGALTEITATSFFPAKPLGCYGDGGALFTDSAETASLFDSIRQHGKGTQKYEIVRTGVNGRLDTLQAAILLEKLRIFPGELGARESLACFYDAQLDGKVTLPPRVSGMRSAWAQYTICVDRRDEVAARLKAEGVPTAVYYPRPLHLQPAYSRFGAGAGSLPVSERLCRTVLSLPMHPYMEKETAETICRAVRQALS